MMNTTTGRLVVFAIALALVAPITLSAQKAQKGAKQKGRSQDVDVTIVFSGSQREAARGYFVETHGRGNCPPGLAKKNNGCLPPGQAKKRYAVGRALPKGLALGPIPVGLRTRIGSAPSGYQYGMVDGDLVKLAVGTLLVVDALEGLVP